MRPFIDTLALEAIEGKGKNIDLSALTYVFPNRRAGLFFTRALTRLATNGTVIALPHVTDINRFVEEQSPLRRADDTELLIWLFKVYSDIGRSCDTHQLRSFIELGTKILHDFNEIDKYLVDAAKLFQNINDLTGLTANMDEEIRHFYDTLLPKTDETPLLFHQHFSALWNLMFPLYDSFRNLLRSKGIAYEGMFFRDLCESGDLAVFDRQIVFAGFNILTESEKCVIEKFKNRRMVFDYNTLKRDDTTFNYNTVNIKDFGFKVPEHICEYACMTSAEEGESLATAICKIKGTIEDNTAIILADESLLIESMNNLKKVKRLNVTMGYPLANTQIANFVNLVIKMQQSIETDSDGIQKIYHKPLLDLFSHPYFRLCCPNDTAKVQEHIRRQNISRIPVTMVQPIDSHIFSRNSTPFAYLLPILNRLWESIEHDDNPAADTEVIDRQFIRQYTEHISSLQEYLTSAQITADEGETYTLIRRLTRGMKIQFRGEPLQGLQVMGLLECRLLDFDNIIFVGFNDQFVPGNGTMNNSIIPYSLRKPYGLPSHEITNSIYAYNFYRMLHRCSHLDLIYATATNEDSKSEVSRFYNQLKYLYGKNIDNLNATSKTTIDQTKNIFTPYFEPTATPLSLHHTSASGLKHFITCPAKFYYSEILMARRQDDIDDTITESIYGRLLHSALEHYYNTAKSNNKLKPEQTANLIEESCEHAYDEVIKQHHNRGYNILAYNSLKTLVKRIVQFDESRDRFTDVHTEEEHIVDINGVTLKARIDRIDQMATGEYVVIDYKTSIDDNKPVSLESMFSIDTANKKELELFQVLVYCTVLSYTENYKGKRIIPQLFKVYEISKGGEDEKKTGNLKINIDGKPVEITDYEVVRERFEEQLFGKLNELKECLSKPELFLRTATNSKNCEYCEFRDLCMNPL